MFNFVDRHTNVAPDKKSGEEKRKQWFDDASHPVASWTELKSNGDIVERTHRKEVANVHPIFEGRIFSLNEVQRIALDTGMTPALIAAVISGTVRPNDEMARILSLVWGEDIVSGLRDDFYPERGLIIVPDAYGPLEGYADFGPYELVPAYRVRRGEIIPLDDGRGVVVSHVERYETKVLWWSGSSPIGVYSGEALVRRRKTAREQEVLPLVKKMANTYTVSQPHVVSAHTSDVTKTKRWTNEDFVRTASRRFSRLQSLLSDFEYDLDNHYSQEGTGL